ncbi:MAG TPA: glycine cleavage system aminomethyltransferase GcvT [Xanthobacteraceae bacterium]|nr:glycine cleavage system aminomethyltransferase GcvT [Xanthobacteraceae bacterium]
MSESTSPDPPSRTAGAETLAHTPLHALHLELGARMGPFAGYDMPIHYPRGILREHLHVRAAAGLFDVSHMGQIALRPRASMAEVALALERLVPADVAGLAPWRQRYAFLTNDGGGIIDDLMIAHCGDHFLAIVNAARKQVDEQHIRAAMGNVCHVEPLSEQALVALQGPAAEKILGRLAPVVTSMRFLDVMPITIANAPCMVSRSGYTGEDGFEISVPAREAERLARALLKDPVVGCIGLGARDSLRLEAGLCLYGVDINIDTSPVEAALEWAIPKLRRRGGSRSGGFLGAARILEELEHEPARRRVGLRAKARTPVRGGAPLFSHAAASDAIGTVTSGGFGPTVGAPVAMGYVPAAQARVGNLLFAEVRGHRVPIEVVPMPFVPHRYKRG